MNIFVPQSIQTQIELEEIADVKKQIITPSTSRTIIGIVQDGLLGAYNMTSEKMKIDWRSAMNMMSYTTLEDFSELKKKDRVYDGKELFSMIIPPKISVKKGDFVVKNGKIQSGQLQKNILGSKQKNNMIQFIWDEYGENQTKDFIDNTQRLINNFNLFNGFTVGIGDTVVDEKVKNDINEYLANIENKVDIDVTNIENNPNFMEADVFEAGLMNDMNTARDDVSGIVMQNVPDTNNFGIMINSGSKGGPNNLGQMVGCVGLQVFEGKIMQKKYNKRTLAYFHENDDRAVSRGLVKQAYMDGLEFPEFVYHMTTGRQGLIDSAIKSVTAETRITISDNGSIKTVRIGDWIDRQLKQNSSKVRHEEELEMELLDIEEGVTIPTTDENGTVTWGDIKAITRHLPGKELYEIKTHGGRSVIVTESKSLLIWDEKTQTFQMKHTPQVTTNDFVPVTMNLPQIGETIYEVSDAEYLLPEYHKIHNMDYNFGKTFGETFSYDYHNELSSHFQNDFDLNNHVLDCSLRGSDEYIKGLIHGIMNIAGKITEDGSIITVELEYDYLIEKINMILTRYGIFGRVSKTDKNIQLIIGKQWVEKFKNTFELEYDSTKSTIEWITDKISSLFGYGQEDTYRIHNDVVLDRICEITKVDVSKYPKVYDLTVPSTLNFGLSNGLHVVDTAETGYAQRKLIKSMEDVMIKYDGTVRIANNQIIQYTYGDSGADTTKQYDYRIKMISLDNKELENRIKFTDAQLKEYKGFTKEMNESLFKQIKQMRDSIRSNVMRSKMNFIVLQDSFMIPINLTLILNSMVPGNENIKEKLDPNYIIESIENLLGNDKTPLVRTTPQEKEEKATFAMDDDNVAKTMLRAAIYDALNPKTVNEYYKMSKDTFDKIIARIEYGFNNNIIEPGSMVGITAAQSLGEAVTQMTLNSFHFSGIASKTHSIGGVPRINELMSASKKPKTPSTFIYLTEENKNSREMAHKIASHLENTTIGHLRGNLDVYYDTDPKRKGGFMDQDNITEPFYSKKLSKTSCQADVDNLPWLIRMEIDKEKMLEKEVTLLEIKSKFCDWWDKRHVNVKKKKEKINALKKITSLAVLSNNDNDKQPVIHIRFNVKDLDKTGLKEKERKTAKFDRKTITDFVENIIDKFKLKGIDSIDAVNAIVPERFVDIEDGDGMKKGEEYVIYTSGVNLKEIRYISGIDINRTISDSIMDVYHTFGIEIARSILLNEFIKAYENAGNSVNYQHVSLLVDIMTYGGYIMSADRHGMKKADIDPLSKASFEKTVDQLISAAFFGDSDRMNGISSRIMAGLTIKGGTGYSQLSLDTDMIINSEFVDKPTYKTDTSNKISGSNIADAIMDGDHGEDIFIPM